MTENIQDNQFNAAKEALNDTIQDAQENGETVAVDTAEELKAMAAERDHWKELAQEHEGWKDKSFRLAAEMENLKKRTELDIQSAKDRTLKNFAMDLLSAADSLSRAQQALADVPETEETKPLKEGFAMVAHGLENTFAKNGIAKVESMGKQANPDFHQVMQQMASAKEGEVIAEGEITQEMQAGYTLNNKLLRPALVITSNGEMPTET